MQFSGNGNAHRDPRERPLPDAMQPADTPLTFAPSTLWGRKIYRSKHVAVVLRFLALATVALVRADQHRRYRTDTSCSTHGLAGPCIEPGRCTAKALPTTTPLRAFFETSCCQASKGRQQASASPLVTALLFLKTSQYFPENTAQAEIYRALLIPNALYISAART
jgi:hypothetical protein